MADRLSGKSVVVTGAGSGIGLEIAERAAQEGASVVLADINLESAEREAAALRQQGFPAEAVGVDISDEESVRALISSALQKLGSIDVFCNNAALTNQEFMRRDVDVVGLDLEVWQRTLDVNLTGTMLCCKHVVPVMADQGDGSIVNTSSGASLGVEEFMRTQLQERLITPYLGRALDIANAAVFLASDESRFITGQILSVDGGLFAYSPTARL